MTTTKMKIKISEKFSAFAISQTVWLHTHRTTDIDELNDEELEAIYRLLFPAELPLKQQVNNYKNEQILKEKRSVILAIATRTGIKQPDSWQKFNNWMLKSSVHKKPLNNYDISELKSLERQFRALENNYNHSAEKIGNKAWYHKRNINQPSNN